MSANKFSRFLHNEIYSKKRSSTILKNILEYLEKEENKSNFPNLIEKGKLMTNKGVSGAQIAIININNKDHILKYYKLKEKSKQISDNNKKCIRFYFPINELIINTIITNTHKFLTETQKTIFYEKKYNQHILKIKDLGIYDNKSYIINEKVGFQVEGKYATSLDDLLDYSIIPLLNKNFENNQVIDAVLNLLIKKLENLFECNKFLNKNLGYVHSDLNCKNVFIKNNNSNNKFSKTINLPKDFILLVSDLDKSTLRINNTTILPYPGNILESKISQMYLGSRFKNIYEMRYQCMRNLNLCNRFKSYHFDRYTLLYDIYIKLYQKVYQKQRKYMVLTLDDFFNKFTKFKIFTKKTLNLKNDTEFKLFYSRINKSVLLKFKKEPKLSFHINAILYNFCNKLRKIKISKKKIKH